MFQDSFQISMDEFPWANLWFAMGYRQSIPEKEIADLAKTVVTRLLPQARLRYMYQLLPAEKLSSRTIRIGGTLFTPEGIICSYLDGMEEACLFVATAGSEFDSALKELNAEGDIVADFIADSLGTVLAELAVDRMEHCFDDRQDHSMSYSPGYCNWNIREQQLLFPMFPASPCGITLSESSLMTPEKSVSGFLAFGEKLHRQPYHCDICKNKNCYKRRESN